METNSNPENLPFHTFLIKNYTTPWERDCCRWQKN
jgi:hypothetical protein